MTSKDIIITNIKNVFLLFSVVAGSFKDSLTNSHNKPEKMVLKTINFLDEEPGTQDVWVRHTRWNS